MGEKMNKYGIVLDGRMDEPVWETVPTYTDFHFLQTAGGEIQEPASFFKILPCEDRIYIGFKCMEPGNMDHVNETKYLWNSWGGHSMEIFLSPSGSPFDFYQFYVPFTGKVGSIYYAEGGNIQPDPYAPVWNSAIYTGDEYWSAEVEIPLTAFYMTSHTRWSDTWLVNLTRTRLNEHGGSVYSTWAPLKFGFLEPNGFIPIAGFPVRPVQDDICISSAVVTIKSEETDGYKGFMTVKVAVAEAADFTFMSDHAESLTVSLKAGDNEFTVPCSFHELGRGRVSLTLKRLNDGKEFKRFYPVRIKYEPLMVKLTLPEYRNNFYPGQDYTKIVGKAIADKPVTLTLEGSGIPAATIMADADGSFSFDTPNFQEGEAWLTATIDGCEVKTKIRRLAPTGHTMTWISGGNLIVDGVPTFSRKFYGPYYIGGTAFNAKYDADNIHITPKVKRQYGGFIEARDLIPGSENSGGEATQDIMPSEALFRGMDEIIEENKDKDFAFYYISDEPECRGVSPIYLNHQYEYLAEKDPYHVVMMAIRGAVPYVECADWFQTHPYVCPFVEKDGTRSFLRPFHTMGGYIDDIVNLNRPDKCMGFLSTCFAYDGYDYVTFDEIQSHSWAAIMHGAKTLWPYAYHDLNDRPSLYEGHRYLFSSVEALEPLLLHGERTTLLRSVEAESVLYTYGEEKMFVVANYTQEPLTVTLEGLSGTWYNFRRQGMLTGNTFELKPLEVLIGTSVPKGTDLPSYAEAVAVVDRLEYERTHTGSLLFARDKELTVTTSPSRRYFSPLKMFDGQRTNDALELLSKEENYLDVDISRLNIQVNKVVLYGYNIDEAKLMLRNGETLVEAPVSETKIEQYATTFILTESISPEALRFQFAKGPVEIYEIEAY